MTKHTKHILGFAAVAVVGYLLYKQYQKNKKPVVVAKTVADGSSSSFIGPEQIVVNKSGMSNAAVSNMKRTQWNGSGGGFNKVVLS